jgi:hypothetical protein
MYIIFTENSLVWPRMQGKKMFIFFNIAKEEESCVTVCTKKINAKRNHRTDKKCMITLFSISQKSRIICQLSLKKRHSTRIETTQIILNNPQLADICIVLLPENLRAHLQLSV